MKMKKIPMRTCVVTKEKYPKKELIRISKKRNIKLNIIKFFILYINYNLSDKKI